MPAFGKLHMGPTCVTAQVAKHSLGQLTHNTRVARCNRNQSWQCGTKRYERIENASRRWLSPRTQDQAHWRNAMPARLRHSYVAPARAVASELSTCTRSCPNPRRPSAPSVDFTNSHLRREGDNQRAKPTRRAIAWSRPVMAQTRVRPHERDHKIAPNLRATRWGKAMARKRLATIDRTRTDPRRRKTQSHNPNPTTKRDRRAKREWAASPTKPRARRFQRRKSWRRQPSTPKGRLLRDVCVARASR